MDIERASERGPAGGPMASLGSMNQYDTEIIGRSCPAVRRDLRAPLVDGSPR
jgi:hypothetical protein